MSSSSMFMIYNWLELKWKPGELIILPITEWARKIEKLKEKEKYGEKKGHIRITDFPPKECERVKERAIKMREESQAFLALWIFQGFTLGGRHGVNSGEDNLLQTLFCSPGGQFGEIWWGSRTRLFGHAITVIHWACKVWFHHGCFGG